MADIGQLRAPLKRPNRPWQVLLPSGDLTQPSLSGSLGIASHRAAGDQNTKQEQILTDGVPRDQRRRRAERAFRHRLRRGAAEDATLQEFPATEGGEDGCQRVPGRRGPRGAPDHALRPKAMRAVNAAAPATGDAAAAYAAKGDDALATRSFGKSYLRDPVVAAAARGSGDPAMDGATLEFRRVPRTASDRRPDLAPDANESARATPRGAARRRGARRAGLSRWTRTSPRRRAWHQAVGRVVRGRRAAVAELAAAPVRRAVVCVGCGGPVR